MRNDSVYELPKGLPVPQDDGACRHLEGSAVPPVEVRSTAGREVCLANVSSVRTIVYHYPKSGTPDRDPPSGWNEIPGARGCTPQSCGFRDRFAAIQELGIQVFGLSTQTTEVQKELADRLHLPFELLSDVDLEWASALKLPTFSVESKVYIKRLTLVLFRGRVEKVFYPVFPPDKHALQVVTWLRAHALKGETG